MNWQPRPSDIEWTRRLIAQMSDGGVWGIPMNQSVWKLDKTNKVFTCIHGKMDDMFDKLTKVCKELGWTTALKPQAMTPQQISAHMMGTGKSLERPINHRTEV